MFPQLESTVPKPVHRAAPKNNELGLVTSTGLPGEAAESILGYNRSKIGGLAKVGFSCRAIFPNYFCPLR